MSVKRDKYEISLWEDVLVAAAGSVPEHYKEKKIAVIGSDNMTAQFRAVEPRLVENINGTNTLTFKMFYAYIDNETGESKSNPFLSLLVNERKVKALWKNKWYDLVIKACQEDSNGKSITYTCKDLYINELSKTGFSLEFNTELKNNQGTVQELAEVVLDGSDWQLAYNPSDPTQIVKQKREESVYELTGTEIVSNFTAYDENDAEVSVTSANKILVYYSVVQNQEKYCQFLFKQDDNFQKEEGSQLVVDGKCLYINLTAWDSTTQPGYLLGKNGSTTILKISTSKTVSNDYRAERLIRTQEQTLDPLIGKYVYNYTYTDDDLLVYGHKETVYNDPTFVNNLLVNYKDFGSTQGWSGGTLYHILYPAFTGDNAANYSAKSYLKFTAGNYLNSGIKQSASFIPDGFQTNEKYIFRFKAMSNSGDKPSGTYITSGFAPEVCAYTLSGTTYTLGTNYFTVSAASSGGDNWVEFTLTCSKSVTKKTLLSSDIGLFLVSDGTYWLEQVEFFPLTMGKNSAGDTVRINPGEMEKQSLAQTAYKYYLANQAVTSAEDLEYLYVGYEDWSSAPLTPIFNGNFEKIRSITAKNSNRFNLLQTLAETFECWAKFTIEHNEETGEVLYDSTGRPKKWVSFHTEIGNRNNIGFIYGIDLKTISRTINSDQITSKIIVSPNKNEFGKNGFCTIARSKENYAKDTFILNFDYYVSQGLLDLGSLNKDLYQSTDAIGYYYWLNKYNKEYDTITEEVSKKKIELTKQESLLKVYSQYLTSIAEEITSVESEIMRLAGVTSMSAATTYIENNPDNTKVVSLMNQWTNLKNSLAQYTTQRTKLNQSIASLKTYLTGKGDRQEELIELIKGKHQEFYNKYSRFIQEGSWISEEYFDDDLYYLDAQSVLYTSSRPQISYNVSVLRLSALEEFKNKIFKLGDISYIQDTEFFGYTWISGVKTPYKEEVLVSEITSNFDSPENDSFQVQNYKTQFEDLFQRITAATQSLQYASGEYQRAANAFTETGAINPLTLQNSFLLNQDLVFRAQNDSVIYDSTGITVTDTSNLNKKVKVTSGGIFISIDGGANWKSAVRGDGISTQYLTAGSINTNNISIMDGNNASFRWDADGINAYWNNSEVGTILNKFVRFDQYGIYGINNWTVSQTDPGAVYNPNVEEGGLSGEEKIWRDSQFGMTWRGFFIKNKYGPGWVEVSSENDVAVYDGVLQRIKLGNFGIPSAPMYGLVIRDDAGQNRITLGNLNTVDNPIYGLKIQGVNGQIGVYTDDQGQFYGQHIYIGPKVYDTRAQLGIIEEYIESTAISTVEEYNATTEYTNDMIVSYNGTYYVPTNDFDGSQLMPTPGTTTDWTPTQVEYSKILSISNVNGDEQIALFDDGVAVFRQADISGAVNATSGMIGGLSITTTGFSGFGFVVDSHGMSFDTTANPNGFTLYQRLSRNFNAETSYLTGGIVAYNGHTYMALQDMEYDGTTDVPTPSGNTDEYWELDDTLDARTVVQNIFSIQDNQLTMVGNGTFTGNITATSGSFNGEIYATRGYVGGLILKSNALYSGDARPYGVENDFSVGSAIWYKNARYVAIVDISAGEAPPPDEPGWENYWALDTDYGMADSPFSIDALGHVVANSITLGTSAIIADYLKLGNSYIYNPEINNNQFISVTDNTDTSIFSLNNAGLMSIGKDNNKILFDGVQSLIQGNNWSITPNMANFSNVTVSGIIKTTVFEKESVQSVNSTLILSSSSLVQSCDPTIMTIWVEYIEGQYIIGDWVIIADNDNRITMKIMDMTEPMNGFVGLDFTGNTETGTVASPISITRLGQQDSFNMAINAADSGVSNLFTPRAITMMQLQETSDSVSADYKLILGKLNNIPQIASYLPDAANIERYGLYADFAYLKGAVVSENISDNTGKAIYTGLNTLNGTNNQNPADDPLYETVLDDTSKIVMWAGAAGLDPEQINAAPFKVTERGYLYAQRGVFSGSVLSESVITDSIIVADSIHISPNTTALHIFDTDVSGEEQTPDGTKLVRGIIFSTGTSENHKHRVGIDKQGIRFYDTDELMGIYVPGLQDPMLDTNGHAFLSNVNVIDRNGTLTHYLDIYPNQIQNKSIDSESEDSYNSRLFFSPNGTISVDVGTNRTLSILQSEVHIQNDLKVIQDFILGSITDSGTRMSYRKVSNGYDLYVEED